MPATRVYRPAPSVHARRFDGELVILDLAGGEYLSLDPIGAKLWDGLAEGRGIEELVGEVVAEYDVAPETARADLDALFAELVERGLLVAKP